MQELGGSADEADGSVFAVGASEQDGSGLFATIRRPMGCRLEKIQLKFYTPDVPRCTRFDDLVIDLAFDLCFHDCCGFLLATPSRRYEIEIVSGNCSN